MSKFYLVVGTVLAGIAVVLGAFGAHGLSKMVAAERLASYQTAVQYQIYHAFALLFVGLLAERFSSGALSYAGLFFLGGIVLFSGSLYLIVSMHAMNRSVPAFIPYLTPLGGVLFIAGWTALLAALLKK